MNKTREQKSDRKKVIAEYITSLMENSQRPRNQIATISGLSNTYLTKIANGKFENIRREKLLFLGIALNLSLGEIDKLLFFFDWTSLSENDFDMFLQSSERQKKTASMLPILDGYSIALSNLAAERVPGSHMMVSPEPPYYLFSDEYQKFSEIQYVSPHPLRKKLAEKINSERGNCFKKNIQHYNYDYYMCIDCLEAYADRYSSTEEKNWRRQHIERLLHCVKEEKNFNLFLLDVCPTASFAIKKSENPDVVSDTLTMGLWAMHRVKPLRSGRIKGFMTNNDIMINTFLNELELIKMTINPDYLDREKQIEFLDRIINK